MFLSFSGIPKTIVYPLSEIKRNFSISITGKEPKVLYQWNKILWTVENPSVVIG